MPLSFFYAKKRLHVNILLHFTENNRIMSKKYVILECVVLGINTF